MNAVISTDDVKHIADVIHVVYYDADLVVDIRIYDALASAGSVRCQHTAQL